MSKTIKGPSLVFDEPSVVTTEAGLRLRVEKWSVRKAMVMGKAISNILREIFSNIEGKGEGFRVADMIEAVPSLMQSCSDELAFIVCQSLTTSDGPQLEPDDVLDTFTLDDFADVLGAIVEKNISGSTLGKWTGLFQRLPLRTTQTEMP